LGIPRAELGRQIGISGTLVALCEEGRASGANVMVAPRIRRLAHALGLDPGDLFTPRTQAVANKPSDADNARRLGAALSSQKRALRPVPLAGALGINLAELHRAADLLCEHLEPLGMTLVRTAHWHLADAPRCLHASERAKLRGAERLRYGLMAFEEDVLYAIATGRMTQEPHDRGGRIALASLINQGLVGDPDSHGYAIHPDVAYSLDIATRVLRSSVRTMSPRAPKRTAKLAGAKRAQPKPTPPY
jgi:hypothetical protein